MAIGPQSPAAALALAEAKTMGADAVPTARIAPEFSINRVSVANRISTPGSIVSCELSTWTSAVTLTGESASDHVTSAWIAPETSSAGAVTANKLPARAVMKLHVARQRRACLAGRAPIRPKT